MVDNRKPSRRPPSRSRMPMRKDPRSDSEPPPPHMLEEHTAVGSVSRTAITEPPPRQRAAMAAMESTETKQRTSRSLVPQMTELEVELATERTERAKEAALMGELLVRVAEVESRLKASEAQQSTLEQAAHLAGLRVT